MNDQPAGRTAGRFVRLAASALAVVAMVPSAARAAPLRVDQVSYPSSVRPEEVAFTISGRVTGLGPEQLSRCIARADRSIVRGQPVRSFSAVRWTAGEEQILDACRAGACKYELTRPMAERLSQRASLQQKKETYFRLIGEASRQVRSKQRKDHRIRAFEVARSVPGACVRDGAFHWLLNGAVKPHDDLRWRKVSADKRMRPTLMTLQHSDWQAGSSVCVGKTMLFADHYYDDHLELFELRPLAGGEMQLQYHVRSHFDFFGSWWARRFKGSIATRMAQHTKRTLRQLVDRCAKQQPLIARN